MLAAILLNLGKEVEDIGGKLHGMDDTGVRHLHGKYSHLIKWFTKKNKVSEVLSQELIDKIAKEDIVRLVRLLEVNDEEAMILILIAANI